MRFIEIYGTLLNRKEKTFNQSPLFNSHAKRIAKSSFIKFQMTFTKKTFWVRNIPNDLHNRQIFHQSKMTLKYNNTHFQIFLLEINVTNNPY